MHIVDADLGDPRVVEALQAHLARARAETAPGSAHALDLDGLRAPGLSLWALWDGEELVALGALKRLSADHGEVKSMFTTASRRRAGAGSAMLRHIVGAARSLGLARLSLETGTWSYFAPARAFYESHGFVECPPFADYALDPNSVFMSLDLAAPPPACAGTTEPRGDAR